MNELYLGSFGKAVFRLQTLLELFGYGDFVPTGYFGNKTLNAVINFQINHGIEAHGVVGPKTRKALDDRLSDYNREKLYKTAIACLGTDVTPDDITPDEYACAETVNAVFAKAFNRQIGGGSSTYSMYRALLTSPMFMRVDDPKVGDIIISPTGYGNGGLSNGHVGIVGKDIRIMSNSSRTGNLEENYTRITWENRYKGLGGYPIVYFRVLDVD